MKAEWKNGLIGGVILSVLSISGNVFRNDPHLISIFPDILTFIVFAVILAYSIRACRTAIIDNPNPQKAFIYVGLKITLSCATVLTIALVPYGLLKGFSIRFVFLLVLFDLLTIFALGTILTSVLWIFRSKIFHGSSATA